MKAESSVGAAHRDPEPEASGMGLEVAVIGMACRFPGAKNIDEFWDNLKNGKESIKSFPHQDLVEAGIGSDILENPNYVNSRGYLEDIEYFDAAFFGYSPLEAHKMHPQIRFFHECTWEALENAGYNPDDYNGLIGLFAGLTPSLIWDIGNSLKEDSGAERFATHNLNSNFFCTLISYKLNLKGPAVTVQTACSTSLVAIHTACRSLLTGECDMALAGGVTITLPPKIGYIYQEGLIMSPDGHCRAFDVNARGTVGGNGVGVVALKLLGDAEEDGDHIYAVIKGSAINNDGNRKVGYTAPSVEGQQEVIKSVFQMSEVDPETVTYVETHGTGTVLGDPIEIEAIKLAFNTSKTGFCRIGSVKTNVGHLDCAAGAAGFIKAVLALTHKQIPPSLHFEAPNPKIDFENSPFVVNTKLTEWKRDGFPRRAGVSSFGIGGTNSHALLEEWPQVGRSDGQRDDRPQLVVVSARSAEALDRAANNLADHFREHPDIDLADAAYTLQVGRKAFEHRRILVCSTADEAGRLLKSEGEIRFSKKEDKHIVFLFPGQGAQYVDMGRELYQTQPVFREEMDRCFEILTAISSYDLKEIVYPGEATKAQRHEEITKEKINRTEITQPVIFAVEYALAKFLMSWGITPFAMIGHSIGEYTAACLAGVFSLEDALKTVALRGKLMQQMPPGSMISVPLPEGEIKPLLASHPGLSLAAVNGSANCVLSGSHQAVDAVVVELKEKEMQSKRLHTSHAFHSPMMDPVLKAFEQHLSNLPLHKPQIPFISNLTGTWITVEDAVDPVYWARHLRETVRFFDGLTELLKDSASLFVEVGPGRVLTVYATQHPDRKPHQAAVNLVRHPKEKISDYRYLLNKIGRLWLYGGQIDWKAFHGENPGYRIPLPAYPFARQAYSIDADLYKMKGALSSAGTPAGKKTDIADWLYTPLWEQSLMPHPQPGDSPPPPSDHWLVFLDPGNNREGLGVQLLKRWKQDGHPVVTVETGSGYRENNIESFVINPGRESDYYTLFTRLGELKKTPRRILHLWNAAKPPHEPLDPETLDQSQDRGFYSLLAIAQAIGKCNIKEDIDMAVVTANVHCVTGDEELYPERATLLGALRVIPKEYPHIDCCHIDIVPPRPGTREEALLVDQLTVEVSAYSPGTGSRPLTAYRSSRRWVPTIKPVPAAGIAGVDQRLKEKGVYLVTGGLGGIGITLADQLARRFRARLILTGRSPFPGPEEYDQWIAHHGEHDPVSRKIRRIQEWEAAGAEVMIAAADIADLKQMREVIARAKERFGNINGVIHSAGVPDFAGVIQRRTRETTEPILAPKVKGTLVLEQLLNEASPDNKPDFLVLCSSLSSILAPLGQVGYCAANAFLDSYAFYKTSKNGIYTVSVNWDAWQQVGMAVEAVEQLAASGSGLLAGVSGTGTLLPVKPDVPRDRLVSHPLFHHWRGDEKNSNTRRYVSYLSAGSHWVLDEHRIMGMPTLPGTAFLEIVRGAVDHRTGNSHLPVEIRGISFISPFTAADGEEKEIHILLEERDGEYTFTIQGPLPAKGVESELSWQTYATGKAAVIQGAAGEKSPGSLDIQAIEEACQTRELRVEKEGDTLVGGGFVTPGPRWNNIKQIKYGEHQAMARLELPAAFAADLRDLPLHPALLDTATSVLVGATVGENTYLPFSYQRVAVHQPLADKLVVYARVKFPEKAAANTLTFDVTLMDNQGRVLVEIESYTLMKLSKEKQAAAQSQPRPADNPAQEFLKDAITPAEGIDVFHRILNIDFPQVLVSTVDFTQRLQRDRELSTASIQEKTGTSRSLIPASPRPELSTPYAAPETQNQQILADIWKEILGVEGIGIRDDFFELGGDSLKAITITARIQKELQVEVPLAEFFNTPTISGLSEYIGGAEESIYSSIAPVEQKEYYPLSSAQKRLYILCRMNPDSVFYNLPQVLMMEGQIEVERFDRAFAALIRRHESLRTSFRMLGDQGFQVVHDPADVQFQVEYYEKDANGQWWKVNSHNHDHESSLPAFNSSEEITRQFIRPFDLSRAPLLRVTIIALEDNKYIWMKDVHHITADATSMAILEKDLFRLYNQRELTPLPLQYKDFSTWQNHLVESGAIQQHEEYWLKQYPDAGQIPELQLPYDFERPVIRQFKGDYLMGALEAGDAQKFMDLAASIRGTFFMNVLAALNVLLFKYSGQPDIIVGTSIAGRPHADLQDILGMFVNMLAVRNFPDENMTYMEFLQKVKTNVLDAFAHQDMQFEKLVDKLGLGKASARNPLFEVALNVQNYEQAALPAGDLKMRPMGMDFKIAKFDLLLWANDMGAGTVADANRGIIFTFEYSTEMFKRSTVEVIVNHLLEIIKQVAENRDIKLKDIKLSHQLVRSESSVPDVDFEF